MNGELFNFCSESVAGFVSITSTRIYGTFVYLKNINISIHEWLDVYYVN